MINDDLEKIRRLIGQGELEEALNLADNHSGVKKKHAEKIILIRQAYKRAKTRDISGVEDGGTNYLVIGQRLLDWCSLVEASTKAKKRKLKERVVKDKVPSPLANENQGDKGSSDVVFLYLIAFAVVLAIIMWTVETFLWSLEENKVLVTVLMVLAFLFVIAVLYSGAIQPHIWIIRGCSYKKDEDYIKAIHFFDKVLDNVHSKKILIKSYAHKSECQMILKNFDEAFINASRAVKIDEDFIEENKKVFTSQHIAISHFVIATVTFHQGQYDVSLKHAEKAIEVEQVFPLTRAVILIAEILSKTNRKDFAIQKLDEYQALFREKEDWTLIQRKKEELMK